MATFFGLIDVNNFFVSCERLFMPHLEGKPVIVLSSNDGCVIARSNEAKALNIAMGEPFFKIKPFIEKQAIEVFSSNFPLYSDMSDRVMEILQASTPKMQIYSIDEAFIDLSHFNREELYHFGHDLVKKIQDWLGLPVSLGIAPTKTLAKVANRIAKKITRYRGVFGLWDETQQDKILQQTPIGEVWGIGYRSEMKLKSLGIQTAYQLKMQTPKWIERSFHRSLEQTALELKGIPYWGLEENDIPKQRIMVSRSFNRKITDLNVLQQAVARHVTRAAEKLRSQESLATSMQVFIRTSYFNTNDTLYENSAMVPFETPTANTATLIDYALQGLSRIYSPGYSYQKAGIILLDLVDKEYGIQDLFTAKEDQKSEKLMHAIDEVNACFGTGTVRYGREGFQAPWFVTSGRKTRAYTTRWDELCYVKA